MDDKNKKILGYGCLVLLAVGLVGALVLFVLGQRAVKMVKETGEEFKQAAPQIREDAEKFAVTASGPKQCVREGLKQMSTCGQLEIKCQVKAQVFSRFCLNAVRTQTNFCVGVPGETDFLDLGLWGNKQCEMYGNDHPQCGTFMTNVVGKFCHERQVGSSN